MIIGTAGHIDHGKTALVRALTGVDTDRLKEEKARGITIDLGFAYWMPPAGAVQAPTVLGFVDVPGHEKFVHNMLAGASGIDFVMLAVAADDGVMPQTREHLAIVDLLGITRGVVVLTKADLVPADQRAHVKQEIAQVLSNTGLAGAEIIPVSVVSGEGLDHLRDQLLRAAQTAQRDRVDGRFRLAVDRCFTLAGAGTVVTGTVLSGAVSVGDHVVVSPAGLSARVRSIHAQSCPSERGLAGERCALNLVGESIAKDAIVRGDVVLDPDLHAPCDRIDASLRVLAGEPKPVAQWMPVRLHHAAADVGARLVLLDDQPIGPGQNGRVQLVLDHPIAAAVGDRFVLRDTSAQRTIGGGRFLDLRAPARKRRTSDRLQQLDACSRDEPEQVLAALLDCVPHYVDLAAFARDRALSAQQANQVVKSLGLIGLQAQDTMIALAPAHWLRLKSNIVAALQAYHTENPDLAGIGLERLRLQLAPRLPARMFAAVLQNLARTRVVALDGAWVRLPGHEVRLTAQDEELWRRIGARLGGSERFRPPRVRDLGTQLGVKEAEVRRLLKLLGRMGKVDEVAHDHFFLRAVVGEMVDVAIDLAAAPGGEFTAAQFRDRLDNGRKVAIQILEFFDRHGVTLRRGDLRRINRHRLDLFRSSEEHTNKGREASLVGSTPTLFRHRHGAPDDVTRLSEAFCRLRKRFRACSCGAVFDLIRALTFGGPACRFLNRMPRRPSSNAGSLTSLPRPELLPLW